MNKSRGKKANNCSLTNPNYFGIQLMALMYSKVIWVLKIHLFDDYDG